MLFKESSYASLGIRIVAFSLDYIVIAGYLFFIVALSLLSNVYFPSILQKLFANSFSGQISGFLIITLPVSLYFILFESSTWQATWGKRRKKIQVVRTDGVQVTILRASSRTLLKFIPWELAHTCIWQISFAPQESSPLITAGFVLVWVLVGANVISLIMSKTHQTLYDWLSGTYVVMK